MFQLILSSGGHVDHLRGHQDHVLIFFVINLPLICHLLGQEASFVGTQDPSLTWNTGQMGPNPMEALKFKQYYCFCTCDVINSLYFPSREIATVATFVELVNKFIGAEFEGLIVGTNTADSKG